MTGVSENTISKLLLQLGAACTRYQDASLRNLPCRRLQCDEVWSFVGGKRQEPYRRAEAGRARSIWTRTALEADTKLIASWLVGSRDSQSAYEFVQDGASRFRGRVQLTADGHRP
jgi:hypothetical protein